MVTWRHRVVHPVIIIRSDSHFEKIFLITELDMIYLIDQPFTVFVWIEYQVRFQNPDKPRFPFPEYYKRFQQQKA